MDRGVRPYLVVILHVDPSADTLYHLLPLVGIGHHDCPAFLIVFAYAHLANRVGSRDAVLLVDLVLDGHAVRIPAEPPNHMAAFHGPVAWYNVLDGGREEMPKMWEPCLGQVWYYRQGQSCVGVPVAAIKSGQGLEYGIRETYQRAVRRKTRIARHLQ
ncbi:hypothetical protein ACCO45_009487 [Purpureocillium lilacinum]|uniref:Uncharacterized protein n=1 Tax=Purpureocillium lilacinum TaxID=33203 RepID=A0ACC4DJU1_PURLI